MNQIKLDYQFDAPIEKVWAILADVTTTPEWVHGVKQSIATDEGKARKGFCWEEKVSIDGQNADIQNEFVEWVAQKHAAIKTSLPMGGWMRKQFQFSPLPNSLPAGAEKGEEGEFSERAEGCLLSIEMTWNLGILEMLAGPTKVYTALEKSLHKTLENWKIRTITQTN